MRRRKLSRLDKFRVEVLHNIGASDIRLDVTDEHGDLPVVAVLESELVSVLVIRVRNVGGNATIFAKGPGGVRTFTVVNTEDALDPAAGEDLASEGNRPGSEAEVGVLLDYIEMSEEGVRISLPLSNGRRTEVAGLQDVPAFS